MDSKPDLDFSFAKDEARPADSREGAGAQRYSHGGQFFGGFPGDPGHLLKGKSLLRGRARDFVNKHRTRNTSAAIRRNRVLQRDIIGDDHNLDRNSFSLASSAANPKFSRSPV